MPFTIQTRIFPYICENENNGPKRMRSIKSALITRSVVQSAHLHRHLKFIYKPQQYGWLIKVCSSIVKMHFALIAWIDQSLDQMRHRLLMVVRKPFYISDAHVYSLKSYRTRKDKNSCRSVGFHPFFNPYEHNCTCLKW